MTVAFAFLAAGPCGAQGQDTEKGFIYTSNGARDPFVPLVGIEEEKEEVFEKPVINLDSIKFQGIAYGVNNEIIAIVNGEMYRVGDKSDIFTVKDIGKDKLVLAIDGKDYSFILYEEY